MIGKIASFELKYQLKNPVFWVGVFIFFLLGFGLTASDNVQIGTPGVTKENGAFPIMILQSISTVFYLFILTAFVANAIVRDDSSGFAPMLRATPVTKAQMVFGRFIGSYAVAVLGFLAVPLGLFIGTLMPWVDPELIGPQVFSYYAWPFLILVIPNLFFASALLFSVSTVTRSLMWSYVAVILLVMAYLAFQNIFQGDPEQEAIFARFDPFGVGAVSLETRYWSGAEYNSKLIELGGILLSNRILILVAGAVLLGLAYWRYSNAERAPSKRKLRKLEKRKLKDAKLAAVPPTLGGEKISAKNGDISAWSQFVARLKVELQQMLRSPGVPILIVLALGFTATELWGGAGGGGYGNDSYPTVAATIQSVRNNFSIFILIIAAFYGGELVWRERERKLNEIVDSAPVPAWAMTIPKVIAIFLLLVAVNATGMVIGLLYQASAGMPALGIGKYVTWFIIPSAIDGLLIAVLAVAIQVLSPNKFFGWGAILAWFLLTIFLSNLGYSNPLYTYAAGPSVPMSDLVDPAPFFLGAYTLQTYWLLGAALLVLIAHLLWPRGGDLGLHSRIARVRRNGIGTVPAIVGAVLLAGMVGVGAYAHYNIKELNTYRTSDEQEERLAEYERRYLQYEELKQPAIKDVKFDVELHPAERRLLVDGRYLLRNEHDEAIDTLHVRQQSEDGEFLSLNVAGATLDEHDEDFGYRIYRFDTPLQPGEEVELTFESRVWYRGFRAGAPATGITPDKTFVNNSLFAPAIGMDRSGLLQDRTARRRQDLPDELRPYTLEDPRGVEQNYVGADWVTSEVTLTTAADQIPIAPGEKVSDVTNGDRRTAVFRASSPILNFFSIQSGDYEVATRQLRDITLEVYYEKGHEWNVPRMLDAMETSLNYFEENFGPYQFDYARIIEFPYASFAQAFAGTMPYSENIGFRQKIDGDPDAVDFVTYVIAHELAHQYWAHQALGGLQQGSTMTTETLASYSAIMVMKEQVGEDQLRRFLKYELDGYLRGRKGEIIEELPLVRVENQAYIHYRKGAMAFFLLAERLGEDRVNAALARYVDRWKFKGPPYPQSLDIVNEIKAEARTPEERALVEDLLEKIVLFDYKVAKSETVEQNGEWVTTITVEAAKYEADGQGVETEVPLTAPVKIGLFSSRPGFGAFDSEDVIAMDERTIEDGTTVITLRSSERPAYVGIDPYNYYIDRNSDDNVQPSTFG
ncbi:ABC transporter permease/M1 family aminopeptidase [Sphingomicrobium marinum]|uniref:ABC transporter permease/M1 family aminopeptidase n=1 Tax=Sphingomicrobium marinum TaxID=1227950 RepID=UPI0022408FDE|nr:ABC transporter permease subunit [Sphingomicrobium marinum]